MIERFDRVRRASGTDYFALAQNHDIAKEYDRKEEFPKELWKRRASRVLWGIYHGTLEHGSTGMQKL